MCLSICPNFIYLLNKVIEQSLDFILQVKLIFISVKFRFTFLYKYLHIRIINKSDSLKIETSLYLENPIKQETHIKVALELFKFVFFPMKIFSSLHKCPLVSGSLLRDIFCDFCLSPSATTYGRSPTRPFL